MIYNLVSGVKVQIGTIDKVYLVNTCSCVIAQTSSIIMITGS